VGLEPSFGLSLPDLIGNDERHDDDRKRVAPKRSEEVEQGFIKMNISMVFVVVLLLNSSSI
jgi:hypothetical protein